MATAAVLMVVCASFMVILSAPTAEAAFATLNQGDKWAVQGSKDLSLSYSSDNDLFLLGGENNYYRNGAINGASLTGKVASAAVFEVVEVTATEYRIKMTGGQELALAVKGAIEADLVIPGTYISEWLGTSVNPDGVLNLSEATTTHDEMGLDAKLAFGVAETVTFTVQKSTMAIKSIDATMSMYVRGEASVLNWPTNEEDYNSTNMYYETAVDYTTFNAKVNIDLNLALAAEFDPYLAMIKSAPTIGEVWGEETYMNGTVEWDGVVDITGLPADMTDGWFTPAMADWGITGFPIDLAAIYNPTSSGPQIDNGTLELNAAHFDPEIVCNDIRTIDDPAFGSIEVYEFGLSKGMSFLYYPAKGYMVGTDVRLNYGSSIAIDLVMESAPVNEVQKSVDTYTDQVKKDSTYDAVMAGGSGAGSGGMDLLIIVVLVVVVAVVAVAGFMFMKKRGVGKPPMPPT
jgi:hypothetical protein